MTNEEVITKRVEQDEDFCIITDEVNGTVNIEVSLDWWKKQSNSDEDCISRTEALNIINIEGKWIFNNDKVYSPVNVGIALTSIKKKIKELSSIQPETVCIAQVNFDKDELQKIVDNAMPEIIGSVGPKPGYWINGFCSNCGIYNASEHKKYCPNCGSKMKTNEHSLDFADQDTLQSAT